MLDTSLTAFLQFFFDRFTSLSYCADDKLTATRRRSNKGRREGGGGGGDYTHHDNAYICRTESLTRTADRLQIVQAINHSNSYVVKAKNPNKC